MTEAVGGVQSLHRALDVLEGFAAAAERLRNFVEKAAQATLVGDVFDDAATGQGLLNYFLRGIACGAVTWGYAAPNALKALGPDVIFDRIGDIAPRLIAADRSKSSDA